MKRFVNHVDHVVYLSAIETIDASIASLEAITDARLERCERRDMGALICVDWSAGLEIVAPLTPRTAVNDALHARLETHGEGLLAVVYGVADLEAHKARLEARGHQVGPLMTGDPSEPWFDRLTLRERFAPPVLGSWMVLSQIDYDRDVVSFVDVAVTAAGSQKDPRGMKDDLRAAEAGIRDLHARYTDAVFRQDADAFADCFTDDGEWRISGRVFRGREEIGQGIGVILANFVRVLISFRTPILAMVDGEVVGRTYIDERCAWKNGNRNISIGRYYERFAEQDGRWRFSWRLFQLLYRGDADLTGTFFDEPDYGPPPGMPPRDAGTPDVAATRWGLPQA